MWNDYDENENDDNFDQINNLDNLNNWEVRINKMSNFFEFKEDAIYYIIDEIDSMYDIFNNTTKYADVEELFELLFKLDSIDFYKILKDLKKEIGIKESFKLINLDDDEPEFREL